MQFGLVADSRWPFGLPTPRLTIRHLTLDGCLWALFPPSAPAPAWPPHLLPGLSPVVLYEEATYTMIPQSSDCRGSLSGGPHSTADFRSDHPGGVQSVFADGSVHFLAQTIQMPLYRWLSTIADGIPAVLP